jgi:polar amino acid transport system substrate-binding protein
MKIFYWLFFICTALLPLESRATQETVVIAAEDGWYPYGGKINGEAAGLGVDLVRASFAAVGIKVLFQSVPYARCIRMVKQGDVLACNEPARTNETENALLWPTKPLFSARSMIYARYPSTESGLNTTSLEGKKVMVTHGFEYGSEFDANTKVIRMSAPQEISVFRMLLEHRGDYALAYEKVANYIWSQNPKEFSGKFSSVGMISETHMYCAFSKKFPNSQRYLDLFNEGFRKITANGEREAIEKRWQ